MYAFLLLNADIASFFSGAMEGIFTRLLQAGEDEDGSDEVMGLIRERLLKFLVAKVKQYGDLEKDVEDYIMQQSKKVMVKLYLTSYLSF